MKESDQIDVVRISVFNYFDVLEEAAIYPLKAVNQTDCVQCGAKIKQPPYNNSARVRCSKMQYEIDQ